MMDVEERWRSLSFCGVRVEVRFCSLAVTDLGILSKSKVSMVIAVLQGLPVMAFTRILA